MLNDFTFISERKIQIIEARNICNYMYDSISYFKKDLLVINTFLQKINQLEENGVKECAIIKFKLKDRNII